MAILENQSPVTLNGLIERFRRTLATTRIPRHNASVQRRWALIDCAKDIHHYYPQTGLDSAAKSLPYNHTTLQTYVYFAEYFPADQPEVRRTIGRLSYSLVREAIYAARRAIEAPRNNPQWWIQQALQNHWTGKHLEKEAQKYFGRQNSYFGRQNSHHFKEHKEQNVQQLYSVTSLDELIAQFHATWNKGNYEERRWHQIDLVKQIVDLSGQDGLLRLGNSENLEISTLRNYSLVGQVLTPEIRQQFPQLKYANALEAVLAARKFSHPPHNSVPWWLEQSEQHQWNLQGLRQAINQAIAEGPMAQNAKSSRCSLADLITQFQQARAAETPANVEANRWEQMTLILQIFELYGQPGVKQLADTTQLSTTTIRNYLMVRQNITPELLSYYQHLNYAIIVAAVQASKRFSEAPYNAVTWWLEQAKQQHWTSTTLRQVSYDLRHSTPASHSVIQVEPPAFLNDPSSTVVDSTKQPDLAYQPEKQSLSESDQLLPMLSAPSLLDPRMERAFHVAQTKLQQADQELMTLQELIDEFNHHLAPFLGEAVELVRRPC